MSREYSPFDAMTLENDRREIKEKMRRLMKPEQHREDGDHDDDDFNKDGSHQVYQDDGYGPNDILLNTDGYDSLHQAVCDERNNMNANEDFNERGPPGHGMLSDITSRDFPPVVKFDARIRQSMDRRYLSIMYLILVMILLCSYCFFLISNKLLHYSTDER